MKKGRTARGLRPTNQHPGGPTHSNILNKGSGLFLQEITMGSYIGSKEFMRKVSKVGEGSDFAYRSKFDPVPSSDLKKSKQTVKKE
jgi:hypothetical protein